MRIGQKMIAGVFGSLLAFSLSSSARAADSSARCEKRADEVIRKSIKNMGVKDWFNFVIDESEVVGKDIQGIPVIRYRTKLIINKEGFYPRASGEVTLLADKACTVSKVDVDMKLIQIEE